MYKLYLKPPGQVQLSAVSDPYVLLILASTCTRPQSLAPGIGHEFFHHLIQTHSGLNFGLASCSLVKFAGSNLENCVFLHILYSFTSFQSRCCRKIIWSKISGWENVQLASNLTVCTWCWLLHGVAVLGWTTPVGVGCYIPTNIVIVVTRVVPVVTRIDWNIHRIVMTMCSLIWTAEMFPVKLLRIFAILSLDNGE